MREGGPRRGLRPGVTAASLGAMRSVVLLGPLLLSACATFPEVDAAERGIVGGPAPVLLPTDDLVARSGSAQADAETGAALAARAAGLRARAGALRAAGPAAGD